MNREDARKAAEVMLAYADGKEVECNINHDKWYNDANPSFNWGNNVKEYRIKPTPTYRPFANAEECWEEMKKHEPFGWVKGKAINADKVQVTMVNNNGIAIYDKTFHYYETAQKLLIFADGSVFGKLTEEK